MIEEVWKPIESLKGRYEISNCGRLRGIWSGKILKTFASRAGYLCTVVHKGHNVNVTVYIHRLVAEAFIPNPQNKKCVNHIDGNKTNNNVSNLEWVTYSENYFHARKLGLGNQAGAHHPMAKLTEDEVREIRSQYVRQSRKGFGLGALAKKYGVCKHQIYSIVHNKTWKNV